jgi:hypothetical protein
MECGFLEKFGRENARWRPVEGAADSAGGWWRTEMYASLVDPDLFLIEPMGNDRLVFSAHTKTEKQGIERNTPRKRKAQAMVEDALVA